MTHSIIRKGLMTVAALAITFPAASAMAADVSAPTEASFVVKSASDNLIRMGVKAFRKGNFEKSVRLNQAAIKTSLSAPREAIAQSNLCASYALLGDMEQAQAACTAALELRPGLTQAQTNKAALTIKLAQK